jgi:hypothetical protein
VCKALGRHVHIDYCRAETPGQCRVSNEVEHSTKKLRPEPDRPKDFLSHNLFWKRSGKSIFGPRPLQCLTLCRVQGSVFARRSDGLCKMVGRDGCICSPSPHAYTHLPSDSMCAGRLSLWLSRTCHEKFHRFPACCFWREALILYSAPFPCAVERQ